MQLLKSPSHMVVSDGVDEGFVINFSRVDGYDELARRVIFNIVLWATIESHVTSYSDT